MACCCRSVDTGTDNKSMKTMHSGNAPGIEAMNRGNAGSTVNVNDADSQAVDWWRHHNGSMNVMRKSELDKAVPQGRKSISRQQQEQQQHWQDPQQQYIRPPMPEEKSQNRLEDRDPLQRPYTIQRELPIRPVDGNVLHPQLFSRESKRQLNGRDLSSSGKHATEGSSGVVEVFSPQLDRNSSAQRHDHNRGILDGSAAADQQREEHMAVIARVDSVEQEESRNPIDPPGTPTRSSSSRFSMRQINGSGNPTEGKQRKKLPLSKFIEKKSKTKMIMEDSDHLSDVPSDIDSVTKERYLLACQMLKTTMIQKEKSLIPIEKEYILSLLGDAEHDDVDSVISEEQVSAIERAALRLENDPIFQQPVLARTKSLQDPPAMSSRRPSRNNKSMDSTTLSVEIVDRSDKNPHTATRKPKPRLLKSVANACNPSSARGARGEVSHDVHIVENPETQYNEEWNDPELNDRSKDELVRFNGWTFQRSNEYPFLILGAEGDDLSPRVMTPAMMEALRGFMPYRVSESNFWLKYSLVRDGASLASLLANIRGSTYTMIGVETTRGEVFGSFTGTPWRVGGKWYGNGEAFLWRLKKPRYTSPMNSRKPNFEREMEVYPFTGYNDLVQYCTAKTVAVGGGDWIDIPCPFNGDTQGIGFMIDGDLAGGETNSCSTFSNPRLAKQTTASSEFSIINLEVWTLTPCVNVKDASRMEMQKLFLDEQGASMMRG